MPKKRKKLLFLTFLILGAASILTAAVMIGIANKFKTASFNGGGGIAANTQNENLGSVGGPFIGEAENEYYKSSAGSVAQIMALTGDSVVPDTDLSNAHVYPNPYKPGSGGKFDADYIMFKDLTQKATIRVVNISGTPVALLEKTNIAVDYYQWDAKNDYGKKLASGVYIYFITNPAGDKARGKFSIIR
jgi:hypothetical protein